MKHRKYPAKLLADSYRLGMILAFIGGFFDAYTFICRGKVFANAQTGNIVLLGISFVHGEFFNALLYLLPIMSFFFGVLVVECVRHKFKSHPQIHWRKIVVTAEIITVIIVGFINEDLNALANILISFTCAMQVEAFRKMNGNPFATTMCTGNLRSGTDNLFQYFMTKNIEKRKNAFQYYGIIAVFICGAALGAVTTNRLGIHAVWLTLLGLLAVVILLDEINTEKEAVH